MVLVQHPLWAGYQAEEVGPQLDGGPGDTWGQGTVSQGCNAEFLLGLFEFYFTIYKIKNEIKFTQNKFCLAIVYLLIMCQISWSTTKAAPTNHFSISSP